MIGIGLSIWRGIRNHAAVVYNWILGTSNWDDAGVWRDSAEWID